MHQVLLNLCINARNAIPEGGTFGIEAANFEVDENSAKAPASRPPSASSAGTAASSNVSRVGKGSVGVEAKGVEPLS